MDVGKDQNRSNDNQDSSAKVKSGTASNIKDKDSSGKDKSQNGTGTESKDKDFSEKGKSENGAGAESKDKDSSAEDKEESKGESEFKSEEGEDVEAELEEQLETEPKDLFYLFTKYCVHGDRISYDYLLAWLEQAKIFGKDSEVNKSYIEQIASRVTHNEESMDFKEFKEFLDILGEEKKIDPSEMSYSILSAGKPKEDMTKYDEEFKKAVATCVERVGNVRTVDEDATEDEIKEEHQPKRSLLKKTSSLFNQIFRKDKRSQKGKESNKNAAPESEKEDDKGARESDKEKKSLQYSEIEEEKTTEMPEEDDKTRGNSSGKDASNRSGADKEQEIKGGEKTPDHWNEMANEPQRENERNGANDTTEKEEETEIALKRENLQKPKKEDIKKSDKDKEQDD